MTARPPTLVLGNDLAWHQYGHAGYGYATPTHWRLVRLGGSASGGVTPPPPPFILGQTKPRLVDPDNPVSTDNVGWDGTPLTNINTDTTIASGQTVTNCRFNAYVNFTDPTSRAVNCYFAGRPPGGTFRSGLVNGTNGGTLDRCTLRCAPAASTYYMDGVDGGGNWNLNRCDISRVVDGVHVNGAGAVTMTGCRIHHYSFYDNDPNHASDPQHPGWSHGDVIQRLSGPGGDHLEGCSFQCFFETAGVVWSGGAPGVGTASGGLIGTPSTALNGGFPNANYSNGISYTGSGTYTGIYLGFGWIDGVNAGSGMMQFTPTTSNNRAKIEGMRFGLGGKPSSAGVIYMMSWPSSSVMDTSGAVNIFDNLADVPSSLRNQPITITATGAKVIPGNFA